ncbi:MAG: hypothetical protein NPIRA04_09840 [Nitrospirales bacterium]|nr:MAG: hypothetical protein NPIRA04_09840 [Nitrospirales bacterium]
MMNTAWKLWLGVIILVSAQGCVAATGPLATLPIVSPTASELNLSGIQAYNDGQWELARQRFEDALLADDQLPEVYFNLALTLHKLEDHQQATEYFHKAGELAPHNDSIIQSSVYRNHLGLSSTFERHMSGGYRYAR